MIDIRLAGLLAVAAFLLVLPSCGGASKSGSTRSALAETVDEAPAPTEPKPEPVKTATGEARVTLATGSSHRYSVTCYLHADSVFVSTPNVPLAVKADGSYTNYLSPRDGGAYIYLIADPPGVSLHGQTTEYASPADAASLHVQGDFGNGEGFGGSTEYLESARLEVSSPGDSGQLVWNEAGGSGFTATWQCR